MEKAIRLAIEKGGYNYLNPNTRISCPDCEASFNCHYALDPLFWQALGKALGWYTGHENITLEEYEKKNWKSIALRFFELKLTNGDETKFWRELLERQE